MPRFFVTAGQVVSGRAEVRGADAAHLARSLRARAGEEVVVVDDAGREHGVILDEVTPARVGGRVAWSRVATGEPQLRLTVLQAIPQQGMDDAVSAMATAGVSAIVPVVSRRTVVRPGADRAAARTARWSALVREAAGLAHRGAVPTVQPPTTLEAAVRALTPGTRLLVADPDAQEPLVGMPIDPAVPWALVIGPEGGLEAAELQWLTARAADRRHLGPRIMPARLAGVLAATILIAAAGGLGTPPAAASGI